MGDSTRISDIFNQVVATDHDLPEKQQRILAASLSLFAEKGFANTSTRDIAERADVAEGTVYRRFKTKEGILSTLVGPIAREVAPVAMREFFNQLMADPVADLHTLVSRFIDNRMDFVVDNEQTIKVVLEQVLFNAERRRDLLQQLDPTILTTLFSLFDKLKERHQLVDWPNDMILQFMVGNIMVYVVRRTLGIDFQSLETEKQLITDFVERGLTPVDEK